MDSKNTTMPPPGDYYCSSKVFISTEHEANDDTTDWICKINKKNINSSLLHSMMDVYSIFILFSFTIYIYSILINHS